MRTVWLMSALLVALSACQLDADDPTPGERTEPSPWQPRTEDDALIRAAATGDPAVMARAAGFVVRCHTPQPCTGYTACTTASDPIECGAEYCGSSCGPVCSPTDPLCVPQRIFTQPRERFQRCYNASGASCMKWFATTPSTNGCGCVDF